MLLVLVIVYFSVAEAFTPLVPTGGWTYYIEATRQGVWPSCRFRFVSWPNSCDAINLWSGAGINQEVTFIPVPGQPSTFYLKTSCGRYLSYPGDCNQHTVDTWPEAGVNQAFRFTPSFNNDGAFEYHIEALGRDNCPYKYLSFPVPCSTNGPDILDLWTAAGVDQTFRIHPVRAESPVTHHWNSPQPCPDPFIFHSNVTKQYELICTGDLLELHSSSDMNPNTDFKGLGPALSGTNMPAWAASNKGGRWAPENFHVVVAGKSVDVIFWANFIPAENTHRIGWAASFSGPLPRKYNYFSPNALNLGMAAGGDIDAHVFADPVNNNHYLVWKTDDNNVGWSYTRIWAQQISFTFDSEFHVNTIGKPVVILDSTGLWWSDSWVNGGSLIEGPEIIKNGDYYYLFFASGRYCQDSYTEGVARSRNVLGPYEKMLVPLLSTGIVGVSNGQKLIGPGHASFLQVGGTWITAWHASSGRGNACVRYPFISTLAWTSNGWPYVSF